MRYTPTMLTRQRQNRESRQSHYWRSFPPSTPLVGMMSDVLHAHNFVMTRTLLARLRSAIDAVQVLTSHRGRVALRDMSLMNHGICAEAERFAEV